MNDDVLKEIARKYGKSVPQIMLAFILSKGLSVIPKTSNLHRLKENIDSLDIHLQKEDVNTMEKLNKNIRIVDPFDREWWNNVPYFD